MLRKYLSPLVLLGALAFPALAHADSFGFTANGAGGGFSGSGTLTTTTNPDGSFTITAISGPGITNLIGPGMFNGNDNLFFPFSTSLTDSKGFAFRDVMGNTAFMVDIFSVGAGQYRAFILDSDNNSQTIPVSLTVTPEPSSFILLGTGILGVFGVARRKYLAL